MANTINWNDANTAVLTSLDASVEVTQAQLVELSIQLSTTDEAEGTADYTRSVGQKLRRLGYSVAKKGPKASEWTAEQEAELRALVEANAGTMTYREISAAFQDGAFDAKKVQGKLLSMELTSSVKPTEKQAATRKYSDEAEATFVEMANADASVEAIAEALGYTSNSIRGKALSLLREGRITALPKLANSTAKKAEDDFDGLDLAEMTIAEIAEKVEKTEKGVKSALTRRGISCKDHDGAAKRAKLDAKAAE